jgi:outer membrane biosynthesis protein TonB
VTVTILAVNKGSTPSKVNITDTVPGDMTLLSGSTMREEYLEANKDIKFSYTIRSDSESPFKLPAAEANYFELGDRGAKIGTKSQEPLIRIKPPPTSVPAPEPTPEPAPTIEPEVEALLNPVNKPSEETVPVVEITEQPKRPQIVKQEPVKPSIDGNVILNFILGCDKTTSIAPQNNKIADVCNLANSRQYTN